MIEPDKKFWIDRTKIHKIDPEKVAFFDVIKQYLPNCSEMSAIEIGCAGGRFLIAFNKTLGYRVYGLDYTGIDETMKNLMLNDIKKYNLFILDFFKQKLPPFTYDVVSAFGFIEHYNNPYHVVERMLRLLKPKGYLILSVPNLCYAQKILHKCFNPKIFETHKSLMMSKKALEEISTRFNLETLHCDYYRSFDFMGYCKPLQALGRIGRKINIPNRWFSPHLLYIGKKK